MSQKGKEGRLRITREDCVQQHFINPLDKSLVNYARTLLSEFFSKQSKEKIPKSFLLKSKEKQLDRLQEILSLIKRNSQKLIETELTLDNFFNLLKISLKNTELESIDIVEDKEISWDGYYPLIRMLSTPNMSNTDFFYTYIIGFSLKYNSYNQINNLQLTYHLFKKESSEEFKKNKIQWYRNIRDGYDPEPKSKEVLIDSVELEELRKQLKRYKY